MDEEKLMTTKELATFLRTTPAKIYNSISKGQEGIQIPKGISIGRRRLWLKSEVLNWVRRLETDVFPASKINIQTVAPSIRRV